MIMTAPEDGHLEHFFFHNFGGWPATFSSLITVVMVMAVYFIIVLGSVMQVGAGVIYQCHAVSLSLAHGRRF
jgi:hypothetical protein